MDKDRLIKKLNHYHIPLFMILGLGLFISRDFICAQFCNALKINEYDNLYNVNYNLISILMLAGWGYLTFVTIRNQIYTDATGRNYPKDHHQFNKMFFDLLHFFSNNDPYKMDTDELPAEDWHEAEGVILCKYKDKSGQYKLVKRNSNANGNLVSFGLPGSGKSTTQAATTAVRFNSHLPNGGCGVFAISIKGDLLHFLEGYKDQRKGIKVFTPDKAEGSCHYDPLQGLDKMNSTERRSFVENMSIIVCPDEQGDNSAFFVSGARDYFCAITHYLLFLHDTGQKEGTLKFPELVDSILIGNVFDVTMTIKNSGCKIAGEYSNSYEGSSEKNVSGIYNHLCKAVRPFNTGALRTLFDGEGDCITPEDLNNGDIYIDVPQDKYDIYAPAMAIIITNFLMAFMRRDDVSSNKEITPILFLLDEAVQLNLDFNLLSKAMSTLRSKKVSLFLLMQSIAQLEGRYGEAHAREIIDLCAYISVFNAQDPKSREYFQKLVGKRKMLKQATSQTQTANQNHSIGINVNEVDEFIFEAADFGNLSKDGINRVLVYANGKYIIGETTPCYE